MNLKRVVARFKDNRVIKGRTNDFLPGKSHFHLELKSGEKININIVQLKAVFFVRDYEGNKNHKDGYNDNLNGKGLKIKVRFFDGEIIIGYSLSYSPNPYGFFMTPADLKSNNEGIFVVLSAVEKIEFMGSSPVRSVQASELC